MDPPVQITLTRMDGSRAPMKVAHSRPGSSVSKYLSTAVSDRSLPVHDANKNITSSEKSRTMKKQQRKLSVSSGRVSPDSMASLRGLKIENTYKLGPDPDIRLRPSKVQRTVENLLNFKMAGVTYDPTKAAKMTSELSDEILSDIKKLGFKRHKFVVHVAMGNVQGQGLHVASRCLCDTNNDGHVTVNYQTNELYVLVTIYAIYFE